MNDRPDPVLLRAALRIHESLCGYRGRLPAVALPEWSWTECLTLQRKLQIAASRRWAGAARRIRQRLQTTLMYLQTEVEHQATLLADAETRPAVASVSEIVCDLAALNEEFDDSRVDLRWRTVTVQTQPIVLEGVNLGPFRIRLEWSRYDDLPDCGVAAVDPRYPSGDDAVTHPHVENGCLCEGDGKAAIRAALQSGRVLDFFLIVRQILQGYNPSSAYVSLSEWDGQCCSDCGGSVCDDETLYCQNCESLLCSECCLGCNTCCEDFCSGCVTRCGGCEQSVCRACLNRCPDCKGDRCAECLAEDGCCAECRSARERDPDAPAPQTAADSPPSTSPPAESEAQPVPRAPVQPDCLGQAAVPA